MNSQISAQRPAGLQAGGLLRVYGYLQIRQWARTISTDPLNASQLERNA